MKFYAYVHDKDELTKPVFVGEFNCNNEGEAYAKANKHPGVKRIVGGQETRRLVVKVHIKKITFDGL
jgi:hypothetical protein